MSTQTTPQATVRAASSRLEASFAAEYGAISRARRAVIEFARCEGATETQLKRIRLAIAEALDKAAERAHPDADPDAIRLSADVCGDRLVVVIEDRSWGIDPCSIGAPLTRTCDSLAVTPRGCGGVRVEMSFTITRQT
jgi:anti-sigma regulatory factor (Ser/Thr protein kinase)